MSCHLEDGWSTTPRSSSERSHSAPRRQFQALNGLRGVAALTVLFYHAQVQVGFRGIGHGVLAVDLFFVLSGFVVAHAYGDRLENGWGFQRFMKARLRRLYPLYALGMLLGCAPYIALHGPAMVPLLVGLGALFIPVFSIWGFGSIYPLNPPAWSLGCEFVVNAAYALIAPKLSDRRLAIVVVVGAVAVALTGLYFGDLGGGPRPETMISGYARALFGFSAGLLLYRLHRAGRLSVLRGARPIALIGAFLLLAVLPEASVTADLAIVLLVVPLIVATASQSVVTSSTEASAYTFLAALSYPLYAIHMPLLNGFGLIQNRWSVPGIVALIAIMALTPALAASVKRGFSPAVGN